MLGRILCLVGRHRPKRNSAFRGAKGVKYAECTRCGTTIRLNSKERWVTKRSPLTERDLDMQHQAMLEHRASSGRSRRHR